LGNAIQLPSPAPHMPCDPPYPSISSISFIWSQTTHCSAPQFGTWIWTWLPPSITCQVTSRPSGVLARCLQCQAPFYCLFSLHDPCPGSTLTLSCLVPCHTCYPASTPVSASPTKCDHGNCSERQVRLSCLGLKGSPLLTG
jgi:hypothetical protein